MARGSSIALSTRIFSKKSEATDHFRKMLNRYKPGDQVSEADAADLSSLLKRHPENAEKIGDGIHHFEVQSADFSTQCFRVVRVDGTWSRFSYKTCITNDPVSA